MRRPPHRAKATVAVLALLSLGVAACSSSTPPAPTVKVDRGTVTSGVSASGTLVSIKQQNLGFSDRGQLAELMVKVGDTVEAGQPLARLDDAATRSQLASAVAKLDQQRASLGKTAGSNTVESAQSSLDSAKEILDATEQSVDATASADAASVDRAKVQLAFDKKQVDKAKDALSDCRRSSSSTKHTTSAAPTTSPAAAVLTIGTSSSSTGTSSTSGTSNTSSTSSTSTTDCTTQEQAVDTARDTVIKSQTALVTAQHTKDTNAAQGNVSIANAKKAVADANSQLIGAQNDKPFDTASADAATRDARTAVDDAQRSVDNAVLKAPVAGTVSAINGSVGDFLAAQGAAESLAPGSDARIPAAAGTATGDGGSLASSSGATGSFITLNNVDSFQLVVPFEESDASKVVRNQIVDVSVDAVRDLTVPGTVVAVAPTADQISGVVSYYATIVLGHSDPRLKDGQTAEAQVTTQKVENVLRLPTAAVKTEGGKSTVNVPGADGKAVVTPFTPGLTGDAYTEVRGGLNVGQDVLLPQATVQASQGGGGPNNNNGGGGG